MYKVAVFAAILLSVQLSQAQLPAEVVRKMINEKNFIFSANTVLPTGGRTRQLTPEYKLRIINDSLIADLPYFGRVYNVDYGASNGGYNFVSTRFDYKQTTNRKGGWTIRIKLRDLNDPNQITLYISETGNTTVNIISNDRQPISYTGVLVSKEAR